MGPAHSRGSAIPECRYLRDKEACLRESCKFTRTFPDTMFVNPGKGRKKDRGVVREPPVYRFRPARCRREPADREERICGGKASPLGPCLGKARIASIYFEKGRADAKGAGGRGEAPIKNKSPRGLLAQIFGMEGNAM